MKQCVDDYNKNNNKYPDIVQQAFNNHFYLTELENVLQRASNKNTLKASDDQTITKIVNTVETYIRRYNTGNADSILDEKITKAIWKKSVLVVGDNILKYSADNINNNASIPIANSGRLGDYYNSRLFAEAVENNDQKPADLREWYAIHYDDRESINNLESDKIQNGSIIYDGDVDIYDSDLETLVKSNLFDIIVSIGYSKSLLITVKTYSDKKIAYYHLKDGEITKPDDNDWDTIKEYARNTHKDKVTKIIDIAKRIYKEQKSKKPIKPKDIFDCFFESYNQKHKNEPLSNYLDIPSNKDITKLDNQSIINLFRQTINGKTNDKLIFIDLLRYSGIQNLIFSEDKIVKFINSCIIALYNYNNKNNRQLNNRFVLTLGTNFPSWALRFMWERLTNNNENRETALISNTIVDHKTDRLITSNDGLILKDESIDAFMKRFTSLKDKYHKEWKENFNNCFVSYLPGDEKGFKDFVDNYLNKIENQHQNDAKLNFVWYKTPTNSDTKKYKLKIYYFNQTSVHNYNGYEQHENARDYQNFHQDNQEAPPSIVVMDGSKEICFDPLNFDLEPQVFIDISNSDVNELFNKIWETLNYNNAYGNV